MIIGNGQCLEVKLRGCSQFASNFMPNHLLKLNDLLFVPYITRNLIHLSKFSKDNQVYFKFHPNHFFVKSHASNQVLLMGKLDESGIYYFSTIALDDSQDKMSTKSCSLDILVNNTLGTVFVNSCVFSTNDVNSSSMAQRHARLGHDNTNVMRSIFFSFVIFNSIIKSSMSYVIRIALVNLIDYMIPCPIPNIIICLILYILIYEDLQQPHLTLVTINTLHLWMFIQVTLRSIS